jgi:hypothetical protein
MNIYLHIGWHKTGTTAIQRLLLRNPAELKRQLRMIYPAAGLYKAAHSLPVWGLQSPVRDALLKQIGCTRAPAALFRDIFEEAAAAKAESIMLSAEEFSPIHRYSLERLARCLEGHRVVVIAYVRRQDEYIESVYNQMVKFHRSRYRQPFEPFIERQLETDRLHYDLYFRQWATVFGRENLRIRVYDRKRFRDQDVRCDFCDVIGLKQAPLEWQREDVNESLDADSVFFLSRFNRVPLTEEQHGVVVGALKELAAGAPARSSRLLETAERVRIVSHYAESNREFAREFLGREEAFEPVDPAAPSAPRRFSDKRFMEILGFVLPRLMGASEAQPEAPSRGHAHRPQPSRSL